MGPVRKMWVLVWKCGSRYRNVGSVSVREMWVLLENVGPDN